MPSVKERIRDVLNDSGLTDDDKIQMLRHLEADALSKERSASEGLVPVDGDDGEELQMIEKALLKFGHEPSDKGAATL